jgi:hypothetical protein
VFRAFVDLDWYGDDDCGGSVVESDLEGEGTVVVEVLRDAKCTAGAEWAQAAALLFERP